jgi:hypothetical protein
MNKNYSNRLNRVEYEHPMDIQVKSLELNHQNFSFFLGVIGYEVTYLLSKDKFLTKGKTDNSN